VRLPLGSPKHDAAGKPTCLPYPCTTSSPKSKLAEQASIDAKLAASMPTAPRQFPRQLTMKSHSHEWRHRHVGVLAGPSSTQPSASTWISFAAARGAVSLINYVLDLSKIEPDAWTGMVEFASRLI